MLLGRPVFAEDYAADPNFVTLVYEHKANLNDANTAWAIVSIFQHVQSGTYRVLYYARDYDSQTEKQGRAAYNAGRSIGHMLSRTISALALMVASK